MRALYLSELPGSRPLCCSWGTESEFRALLNFAEFDLSQVLSMNTPQSVLVAFLK
jgi:hypothetical protein